MLIIRLAIGGILLETFFLPNFLWKFCMCFFKFKHSIGHISGMVGPNNVKWKGGASAGYWVNHVTGTFDLTHELDLSFFKVKFQNSCISGIVIWLMWNKKKIKSIRYWADCMILPFDHTHDLDLVVSRSKFEIAMFEEWEDWLPGMSVDHSWPWSWLTWSDWLKGMSVDHSWPWSWPSGNHGGVGGIGCTGQWPGWLQMLACRRHIYFVFAISILFFERY